VEKTAEGEDKHRPYVSNCCTRVGESTQGEHEVRPYRYRRMCPPSAGRAGPTSYLTILRAARP
jgi:hypothetical protein